MAAKTKRPGWIKKNRSKKFGATEYPAFFDYPSRGMWKKVAQFIAEDIDKEILEKMGKRWERDE